MRTHFIGIASCFLVFSLVGCGVPEPASDAGSGGGSAAIGGGGGGGGSAEDGGLGGGAGGGGAEAGGQGGGGSTGGGSTGGGGGGSDAGSGGDDAGAGGGASGADGGTTDGGSADGGPGFPTGKYTLFNRSGTRLQAVAILDELDNSKVAWFIDSMKGNARCTVRRASDGELRCLPTATTMAGPVGSFDGAYFSDAACSQTLLRIRPDCTSSPWFWMADNSGTTIFQRTGGPVTTGLYALRRMPNNTLSCVAATAPPGEALVPAVAVPPGDFVRFTQATEGSDPQVQLKVLRGDDLSQFPIGLIDAQAGASASLVQDMMGDLRLVPMSHSVDIMARKRICNTSNYGHLDDVVSPPPRFVEVISFTSSGRLTFRYYEIVSTTTTYCDIGSSTPQTAPAGKVVYVLADTDTPLSTFPVMNHRIDMRAGQRFWHLASTTWDPIVPLPVSGLSAWFDGAPSQGYIFTGGALHRTPASGTVQELRMYGDAACTQPLIEATTPADVVLLEPDFCEETDLPATQASRVFTAGPVGGSLRSWFEKTPSGCVPRSGQVMARSPSVANPVSAVLPPVRTGAP
jgi:hypothetical protein